VSWLAGKFKTREQKRSEAVRNIRDSLNGQLVEQRQKIVYRALESFDTHARSVSKAIDRHFEELSYGIGAVAERLESTEKELAGAADYLNRAYAKRIVDWATGTREALSDTTIDKVIRRVERNFGDRIVIETTSVLSLTKPIEEICRILQENTLILPIRSD
jgi:FtsZ-interacting cell division protein YlmF